MQIALPVVQKCLNGFAPETVFHVGAHQAEEAEIYKALDSLEVHWVEAQPELCSQLKESLDPEKYFIYNVAAWSKSGVKKDLLITNNSLSSSLFSLKSHLDAHPELEEVRRLEVSTTRLDEILPRRRGVSSGCDSLGAKKRMG